MMALPSVQIYESDSDISILHQCIASIDITHRNKLNILQKKISVPDLYQFHYVWDFYYTVKEKEEKKKRVTWR